VRSDPVTAKREKVLPLLKVSVAEPRMLKFQHCQKEETAQFIWDQSKVKKNSNFLFSFSFWLLGNHGKEKMIEEEFTEHKHKPKPNKLNQFSCLQSSHTNTLNYAMLSLTLFIFIFISIFFFVSFFLSQWKQ